MTQQTGQVSETLIRELVERFYEKVRRDPDLGPIFETAIRDWDAHLDLLTDFWSSVMLKTGRFHGQPVEKHRALPRLKPEHFPIWLGLFAETAREVCPPAIAADFIDRSERIAASLSRAVVA